MFETSAKYGLYNPALYEDIGRNQINMMFPGAYPDYHFSELHGININGGQPLRDTYAGGLTRKQKDKILIQKLLIGAAALATVGFAIFGGKKGLKSIKNSDAYKSVKKFFGNLFKDSSKTKKTKAGKAKPKAKTGAKSGAKASKKSATKPKKKVK